MSRFAGSNLSTGLLKTRALFMLARSVLQMQGCLLSCMARIMRIHQKARKAHSSD